MLLLVLIIFLFAIGFWAPRHSHRLQQFLSDHLGRHERYWHRIEGVGARALQGATRLLRRGARRASEAGRKLRERAPF